MYKRKSHSGIAKRFKRTKSGLIKAARQGRRHLLTKKSAKRKRSLRTGLYISKADRRHFISVLPA